MMREITSILNELNFCDKNNNLEYLNQKNLNSCSKMLQKDNLNNDSKKCIIF